MWSNKKNIASNMLNGLVFSFLLTWWLMIFIDIKDHISSLDEEGNIMRSIYFLRKYLVGMSYFSLVDKLVLKSELVKRVADYKSWFRVIGGQVGIKKFKKGCLLVWKCGLGIGFGWARTRNES